MVSFLRVLGADELAILDETLGLESLGLGVDFLQAGRGG